jgi:hypothetical protein
MAIATVEATSHRAALRTALPEVAERLQEMLGQKLIAVILKLDDAKAVGRWARRESAPRAEAEGGLRDLWRIVVLLKEAGETDETIRAWFMGMNPHLEDRSPALAFQEEPKAVLLAAKAFIAN